MRQRKTNGSRGFTYRSYSFKDKDPVIDRCRSLMNKENLSYGDIHIMSGVSTSTIRNWFEGETKKPQYATIAAFVSSMGYTQKFVKARNVNYEKELQTAKAEIEAAAAKK